MNKMKESERLEKVREVALTNVNLDTAIQVDTGAYLIETPLGFAEIKVVAKKSTFSKEEAQFMVDEYARKLAERQANAEKKAKDKAEKLAKAELKKKAKDE